jgi:pyridoxamine 5'-phosphate oxidase
MSNDVPYSNDPWVWFRDSFARATQSETFDASRAALATVSADAQPFVRFVLVKQVDARGFVFFTNGESAKGRQLAAQPRAALAFHWSSTGEQVRAEGNVSLIDAAESDAYFATRPRGSQLSAWASEQSAPIADRAALVERYREIERRFADMASIPRPSFWGGYRLHPERIEFWHDRADRLHDRWSFTRQSDGWLVTRLQP